MLRCCGAVEISLVGGVEGIWIRRSVLENGTPEPDFSGSVGRLEGLCGVESIESVFEFSGSGVLLVGSGILEFSFGTWCSATEFTGSGVSLEGSCASLSIASWRVSD